MDLNQRPQSHCAKEHERSKLKRKKQIPAPVLSHINVIIAVKKFVFLSNLAK